jgi:hypothetical protein
MIGNTSLEGQGTCCGGLVRVSGLVQREVLLEPRSLRFQQQRFVVVVISFIFFAFVFLLLCS